MKKTYTLLAIVLLIVVIGVTLFFTFPTSQKAVELAPAESTISTSTPTVSGRTIPPGEREFRSDAYKFSLLYPEELHVLLRNEGKGASTIIFQNLEKKDEEFQIFVVPYPASQISDVRFKKDVPSGVRNELRSVPIDTETGAAFYSYDESLGDTAEVWFTHNGYLFEVTTTKSLGNWMGEILQRWQFI
jgi:hypothetical protein